MSGKGCQPGIRSGQALELELGTLAGAQGRGGVPLVEARLDECAPALRAVGLNLDHPFEQEGGGRGIVFAEARGGGFRQSPHIT